MMKAVERIRMANMPFDKFINGKFIHATGFEVLLEDGEWEIEYEGEEFEDADNCIFEYEEEEDEEEEDEEEEEEEEEDYRCIYENDEMTVEA